MYDQVPVDRLTDEQISRFWTSMLEGWNSEQALQPDDFSSQQRGVTHVYRTLQQSNAVKLEQYCKQRDDLRAVFFVTALSETFSAIAMDRSDTVIAMPVPSSEGRLTMPIRLRMERQDYSYREALQKALEVVKECYRYTQDERAFRAASSAFPAGANRIQFIYEPLHGREMTSSDRLVERLSDSDSADGTEVIVAVSLNEPGQEWRIDFYSRPEYSRTLLSALADVYMQIINEAMNGIHAPLETYNLLTEQELSNQTAFNANSDAFVQDERSIPIAFEHIAAQFADRIAVIDENVCWSYRELRERALRVSACLRDAGIGPGERVAVMMERSAEWTAVFLGIVGACCVYVPIDSAYPADRINAMLQDSGPKAIIGDRGISQEYSSMCIPVYEAIGAEVSRDRLSDECFGADPNAIAYILFTSGSTGRPKGVMIEHRGVVNLADWFQREMGISEHDRVVQFASASFDASIWEMAMALLTGAALVIAGSGTIANPRNLEQLLQEHGVTAATLPPAYASQLSPDRLPQLRTLITAGSEAQAELLKRWGDNVRYWNAYGPTETTVCATAWAYDRKPQGSIVPIGRPLLNVSVYVVNAKLQRLPAGIPGELCVGGIGLARGYWKLPALTDERFVHLPECGTRVYRTGDLVRWNDDGNLAFLGRIDQQVKIRGYRIETEEVALAIRGMAGIQAAVVAAKPDERGEDVLIAYYVCEGVPQPTASELASQLAAKLPRHMMPGIWVRLPSIPLTINGKPDRIALPGVMEAAALMERETFDPPAGPTEGELARLWEQLLAVGRVGRRDRFIEIGGHSLKAAKLASALYERFGVDLPMEQLLDNGSLAEMAALIDAAMGSGMIVQPILPAPQAAFYLASPAQRRIYAVELARQSSSLYVLPFAFWVRGDQADAETVESLICRLILRHEPLRTSFGWRAGELCQLIADNPPFTLNRIALPIEELPMVADRLAHSFDLSQAPLLHADWIEWSDGRMMLYIQLHHLIADGLSLGVLLHDMIAMLGEGDLPPLRLQYKDYTEWLLANGSEADDREQLEEKHWLERFDGFAGSAGLPIDYAREGVRTFAGDTIAIDWDEPFAASLRALANSYGTTLHMTLLAAYFVLLARTTGANDWTVGSLHAGRSHPDAAGMVGMFAHTLAHRSQLIDDMPFSDYVQQVKLEVSADYAHAEYPFELLVRKLGIRETSRNPLFDTMFVLQNLELPTVRTNRLTLEPHRLKERQSRFDLVFQAWDNGSGMLLWITYAASLFRRDTVERLSEDYRLLLEQAVAEPQKPIGQLRISDRMPGEAITHAESAFDFEF